jgi:pimeloyl-ACP methyl ester carboxylesterase
MSRFTASDGTDIFYRDWGSGQPVAFSHGWPLDADAWDGPARLVAENGFQSVAHGDDDQIAPIAAGLKTAQLVKDATLKVYPGAPHGLVGEFEKAFNADLLDFIRG